MNIKNLTIYSVVVTLFIAGNFVLLQNENNSVKYLPRHTEGEQGIAGALEWYNQVQQNPETGTVDFKDVMTARQQVARLSANKSRSFNIQWENVGPNNVGGRTRAILVDKDNSNIIYAGSVSGGLFKSNNGGLSWHQVNGGALFSNIAISCIGQAPNGDIYVGTGEYFATPSGTNSNSGAYGQGMWKSTDGETFTHLLSTWPDTAVTYDASSSWIAVNEIAINQSTGRIYAATKNGLYVSDDGGTTWTKVLTSLIRDVKVAPSGKVYAIRNNNLYVSTDGNTFTGVSGVSSGGRMEIAIAPSNENYVYIFGAASDGSFGKMYRSTDGGTTFSVLFDGSSETLSPFGDNKQGWYDNIIAVYPDDPTHIIFGGVDLYTYSDAENYAQLTGWYLSETNPLYVHADQHAIVFDPKYDGVNNKNIYFGCDGGIFKSDDGGVTFSNLNRDYVTTQFYGIGTGIHGDVIGGCQDNGSIYIDRQGNEPTTGQEILGGDGGAADISFLRPDVLFVSMYYGQIYRTETMGSDMDYMYDSRILGNHNIGVSGGGEPFVTRFALWESFNDIYSTDSVMYHYDGFTAGGVAKDSVVVGDTILVQSNTKGRYIKYILTNEDLLNYPDGIHPGVGDSIPGDSVKVKDPYQAAFAVGLNGEVFVTRDPVDFTKVPCEWALVATTSGAASALAWSKDGNYLYIGDGYSGNIYRVSNFNIARTKQEMEQTDTAHCLLDYNKIHTFNGRYVSSISVDPQNPANIVVTLGNYGQSSHVFYSTNATSASPTFIDITGNLPEMPVYASTILWNNSLKVIIGTEYGAYACENVLSGSPVWEDVNENGMANVPVYQLVQQVIPNFWDDGNKGVSNHGYIYAGTHGKGIYQTSTFHGPVGVKPLPQKPLIDELALYPNPASDFVNIEFDLDNYQTVDVSIYNLKGQKVLTKNIVNQSVGQNHIQINIKDLSNGVYLVKLQMGDKSKIKKLIIN